MSEPSPDEDAELLPPWVPEPAERVPVLAELALARDLMERIGHLQHDLAGHIERAERGLAGGFPQRERSQAKARKDARAAANFAAEVEALPPIAEPPIEKDRGQGGRGSGSSARIDKLVSTSFRAAAEKSGPVGQGRRNVAKPGRKPREPSS